MGLGKDVITKPFGFLPFLRFVPPYRSKFLRLSKSFQGNLKMNLQIKTIQQRFFQTSQNLWKQPLKSMRRA